MSADRSTAGPPRTVLAQWALVSKRLHPSGTYAIDGYEVVGTSGPLGVAQSLQEASLTGTPSSTAVNTADALPWVVVTAGNAQRPVMAMSVVVPSPLRTEGGRAVTPTRILWMDWADAARCRMSWAAMADAHRAVRWFDTVPSAQAQGEPLPVQVDDTGVATVAEDVDRIGFDWVAGLAGLVLEGRRIAIVAEAAPLPGLEERLRLFDAVCALLPYGCRARFSAATWAKANVEHGVAVVFADAVAKDQHRVVWQAPLPRPRGADATEYVDALLRLRLGEAKFSTRQIVEHLLGEADPHRCRDAGSVRGLLVRMDLAREVVHLIRSNRGTVADAQRVLAEHPLDQLPSQIAQTLVQFLADRSPGDPAAQDLLVRTWSAETERRLGAYGRSLLTAAELPRLRLWFELTGRVGPAVGLALLREVLRPTESMPDLRPAPADVAVQLLSEVKGAITDKAVKQMIVHQPAVCVALLRQFQARSIAPGRAVEQIELWLRDPSAGDSPWLAPFGFAIGGAEPTVEQWRALRNVDDRVWPVLLRIAAIGRQSGRVFASMWPFLVERACRRTTPAGDEAFDAELAVLTPARCGLPAIEWARIDVLHLIRSGSVPGLVGATVPPPDYWEAFRTAWNDPAIAEHRAGLSARLVETVLPESGTPARAAALMTVVSHNDPQLMDLAARAIAREIDARPADFGSLAFRTEWIDRIRRFSTKEGFWAYQSLRAVVETTTDVEHIAESYAHGRRVGLTFDNLEDTMACWIRANSPPWIRSLLISLWRRGCGDDAEKLRRGIASGEYGGREVAERWNSAARERYVFAQWLAGKSKPPRGVPRPAPPPRRGPAAPDAGDSRTADASAGKKRDSVTKRIGNLFHGTRNAESDERPAADHG